MRFHPTIAEDRKHLRRIAALLCALAGLAEQAAGRSRAVCCLVLWLIRPAEAVARDFVDQIAPGAGWPPAPRPLQPGDGAAEALRLAHSLRALAATLAALAELCLAAPLAAAESRPPAGRIAALFMRPHGAVAAARLDSS